MSYLLRVVLPDRPGMLGAVATALGEAGGDILSLDVVERGPDGAVDDLLVQLPPGGLADVLITSARSVPGVVVESLRPYLGADDLHRDLELVDDLAADPSHAEDLLVAALPGVFRASWALLVREGEGVVRASAGAPQSEGLGMRVVAEGVEDRVTWDALLDLGCDVAQGWYVCRPQPADVVTPWLLERQRAAVG